METNTHRTTSKTIDDIEFRYSTDNQILENWNESGYDSVHDTHHLNHYKIPQYNFQFLFCLCKAKNIKAEPYLKKYLRVEASIAIVSLVGSLSIAVWGLSFFTLQEKKSINTDRELIALLSGSSGFIFFGFKFYTLIKSLKILKRRSFDPLIGCAVSISIASHILLIILLLLMIFLSYRQGFININDGKKGHRSFEENVGFFLVGLCFPLFLLLLLVIS